MIWRKMEGLASGIAILRARRSNFASAASSYSRRRQGQEQGDVFLSLNNSSPFSTTTECDYKPPLATSSRIVPATTVHNVYYYIKYPKLLMKFLAERSKLGFNNPADSVVLFDRMVQLYPLVSRVADFNNLFTILARFKLYPTAIYLIRRMRVLGIPIDQFTLNVLLSCYCRLDGVHYGLSIIGSYFKLGYEPHQAALTVLMNGLIGENKIVEALELWNMFTRKKVDTKFNMARDATIMNALFKAGDIAKTIWVLNKMEYSDEEAIIHATIINGLCKLGHVDTVISYFFIQDGDIPGYEHIQLFDSGTYYSFLKGLLISGKCAEAEHVFHELKNRGKIPEFSTYAALLDSLCNREVAHKGGEVEDNNELWYKWLKPDFCHEKIFNQAEKLLLGKLSEAELLTNEDFAALEIEEIRI